MDPATLITTALALGAAASLKNTAARAVMVAYQGLRSRIASNYSPVNLDLIEERPESKARQAAVQEDLSLVRADLDVELVQQAKELLDIVVALAPEAARAIGMDLGDVIEASGCVEGIVGASSSVSVRNIEATGDIVIRLVRASSQEERDPN